MESQVTLLPEHKLVVVVGLAGCGKSTIARSLHNQYPHYNLIETDKYIDQGLNNNQILYDINCNESRYKLIEGVSCFRLLKDGLDERCFYPDVVINVMATEQIRGQRRPGKNYKQMDATLRLVWMAYNRTPNEKPPMVIDIVTE